jgi:hypothetical protein
MEGVSTEQGWEWAAACFRDAVRRAEERGVTLCFEPLAPAETNFVNTAAEAIRFAQSLQPGHEDHSGCQSDVRRVQANPPDHPRIVAAFRLFPCQ